MVAELRCPVANLFCRKYKEWCHLEVRLHHSLFVSLFMIFFLKTTFLFNEKRKQYPEYESVCGILTF